MVGTLNLAVSFQVMQGRFDCVLDWPCKHEVRWATLYCLLFFSSFVRHEPFPTAHTANRGPDWTKSALRQGAALPKYRGEEPAHDGPPLPGVQRADRVSHHDSYQGLGERAQRVPKERHHHHHVQMQNVVTSVHYYIRVR